MLLRPLLKRLVALGSVAGEARGHKVSEIVGAAARHWHHMIAFEATAAFAAISAGVVVTRKNRRAQLCPYRSGRAQMPIPERIDEARELVLLAIEAGKELLLELHACELA